MRRERRRGEGSSPSSEPDVGEKMYNCTSDLFTAPDKLIRVIKRHNLGTGVMYWRCGGEEALKCAIPKRY